MWQEMSLRGECYLLMTLAFITWCCTFTLAEEVKPTVASIDSQAGLYFDEIDRCFSTQLNGRL
jgi:hypothetical protein